MNILAIISECHDPVMGYILKIIKNGLHVIQIVGPIVGIVSITLILIKLMSSPDEKKYKTLIKNWLIATFMLFLLPLIINLTMQLFDDSFSVSACWNSVNIVRNINI